MFRNKRASLEISIQAIVIVILAMTLLGLGLGFIRGMFGDITKTTSTVSEQIRQQITNDLITNDKKISFPKTQIVMDKGGSDVLTVGIRNKEDAPLCYKILFDAIRDENGQSFDAESWFQYAPGANDNCETIAPADAVVKNVRIKVPKSNIESVSYFLQFKVIDNDVPPGDPKYAYASQDFFIVVRG